MPINGGVAVGYGMRLVPQLIATGVVLYTEKDGLWGRAWVIPNGSVILLSVTVWMLEHAMIPQSSDKNSSFPVMIITAA